MTELTSAVCNPAIEFTCKGTGKLNGVSGAKIEFDAGEPGTNEVTMKIWDNANNLVLEVSGFFVLEVSGFLNKGNHQAHKS